MLQLRMLCMPDSNQGTLAQAFASAAKAAEHLAKHVLTSPETDGWKLIEPRFAELLASNSNVVAWLKMAKQTSPPRQLQPLYDVYCDCVDTEMRAAQYLGWYKTELGDRAAVCVALGTSGVLAVFERTHSYWVLRTAFIAGLGDPVAVRCRREASHTPEATWDRSRTKGMIAKHPKPNRVHHRDEMIRQQRRRSWSSEQRVYYEVFRPALQFIFRQYLTGIGPDGQPWRRDYALLKDVLPSRKRVSFATWQEIRRQCRLRLRPGSEKL